MASGPSLSGSGGLGAYASQRNVHQSAPVCMVGLEDARVVAWRHPGPAGSSRWSSRSSRSTTTPAPSLRPGPRPIMAAVLHTSSVTHWHYLGTDSTDKSQSLFNAVAGLVGFVPDSLQSLAARPIRSVRRCCAVLPLCGCAVSLLLRYPKPVRVRVQQARRKVCQNKTIPQAQTSISVAQRCVCVCAVCCKARGPIEA